MAKTDQVWLRCLDASIAFYTTKSPSGRPATPSTVIETAKKFYDAYHGREDEP